MDEEERAGCFALHVIVFLSLLTENVRGVGWSAVCDCGIS